MLDGEEPYRGCRRHRREEGDEPLLQALPSSVKNRQIGHPRMSASFRGRYEGEILRRGEGD